MKEARTLKITRRKEKKNDRANFLQGQSSMARIWEGLEQGACWPWQASAICDAACLRLSLHVCTYMTLGRGPGVKNRVQSWISRRGQEYHWFLGNTGDRTRISRYRCVVSGRTSQPQGVKVCLFACPTLQPQSLPRGCGSH